MLTKINKEDYIGFEGHIKVYHKIKKGYFSYTLTFDLEEEFRKGFNTLKEVKEYLKSKEFEIQKAVDKFNLIKTVLKNDWEYMRAYRNSTDFIIALITNDRIEEAKQLYKTLDLNSNDFIYNYIDSSIKDYEKDITRLENKKSLDVSFNLVMNYIESNHIYLAKDKILNYLNNISIEEFKNFLVENANANKDYDLNIFENYREEVKKDFIGFRGDKSSFQSKNNIITHIGRFYSLLKDNVLNQLVLDCKKRDKEYIAIELKDYYRNKERLINNLNIWLGDLKKFEIKGTHENELKIHKITIKKDYEEAKHYVINYLDCSLEYTINEI